MREHSFFQCHIFFLSLPSSPSSSPNSRRFAGRRLLYFVKVMDVSGWRFFFGVTRTFTWVAMLLEQTTARPPHHPLPSRRLFNVAIKLIYEWPVRTRRARKLTVRPNPSCYRECQALEPTHCGAMVSFLTPWPFITVAASNLHTFMYLVDEQSESNWANYYDHI